MRHRIAVVGAGRQAKRRGQALLDTGRVEVCGVASRHTETAQACAQALGSAYATDDYRELARLEPEAVLIEVPHAFTHEIAVWALERGCHLYIGGPIASSVEEGREIVRRARDSGLVVEGGYDGRYSRFAQRVRHLVREGCLGQPVFAQSVALYHADPRSWYYDEEASGGMPLTHMSYCFLDFFRWIFGEAERVFAAASRKAHVAPGLVREETCGATVVFGEQVFASLVAGYVQPEGYEAWQWRMVCTEGVADSADGVVLRRGDRVDMDFEVGLPDDQATAFLDALEGGGPGLCPGADALQNVVLTEAIARAARTGRPVEVSPCR
jgi:predicted dehydrogenase